MERVWTDPDLGTIFSMKGLIGAAFFRLFLLLLTKRGSHAYS
jgi:hypothetical protein